jgi:hypothetical protein
MKPDKSSWKYIPPFVIFRYWLFQGMVYMNWVERFHRFVLETVFFTIIFIFLPCNPSIFFKSVGAFFLSHTLMVLINGHVIALCVHDLFWFSLYKDKIKFFHYIEEMKARLNRKAPKYLRGVFFWGSLTRGDFNITSDLDVRFIPQNGFWAGFLASHMVFIERFHAVMAGFPLDAYMFRNWKEIQKKMDVENEPAVGLYIGENINEFEGLTPIDFEQFKRSFIKDA